MKTAKIYIEKIPVIIWGAKSDKAYIYVHRKRSDKESAKVFAQIAESKGYQTISFDLPEHGERISEKYRCDIWNGISDLHQISSYMFANWKSVSLCACSLCAYFILQAYREIVFEKCFSASNRKYGIPHSKYAPMVSCHRRNALYGKRNSDTD